MDSPIPTGEAPGSGPAVDLAGPSGSLSLQIAARHLGRRVRIVIDRPYGSAHPVHGFRYETNYGYLPGTRAPDGEELDAYYLGPREPLAAAEGTCIAIVHRLGDDDDKLVVVDDSYHPTDAEILAAVAFQEIPGQHQLIRSARTSPRR